MTLLVLGLSGWQHTLTTDPEAWSVILFTISLTRCPAENQTFHFTTETVLQSVPTSVLPPA